MSISVCVANTALALRVSTALQQSFVCKYTFGRFLLSPIWNSSKTFMTTHVILLSLVLCHSECIEVENLNGKPGTETLTNSTEPGKDMYVIHAILYQVGIVTNKTDNKTGKEIGGDQTSVTFFNTNGSNIDLSKLPTPLGTIVTAQRLIGVAPAPSIQNMSLDESTALWNTLGNNTALSNTSRKPRKILNSKTDLNISEMDPIIDFEPYYHALFKRSIKYTESDDINNGNPVKLEKGVSIIPQEAGVQSIVIPPLLTLNSNWSQIPVPIPNTSVVHYAKVNTLFNKP